MSPASRDERRTGRMAESQEFRRIRAMILAVEAPIRAELETGPGDDGAVLLVPEGERVIVSADLSVERIHFRREWLTWESIGFRAVAAALSDLAAMAARPIGVLVSLAVPPETDERTLEELAHGIGSCLREHGGSLLGGDLSRSPGPVVIDVTAIGAAERPVLRSGARPGDELWVTGRLGGAGLAAASWSSGLEPDPAARRAFERPTPRLAEARALRETADVGALIDLSDGLAADARQLAAASGVQLTVDSRAVPLHPALEGWAQPEAAVAIAVGGGEDYELLASLAPDTGSLAAERLRREFDLELTLIGSVTEGNGVEWLGSSGRVIAVPAAGFDHFDGRG